jgi:hypothetical protein
VQQVSNLKRIFIRYNLVLIPLVAASLILVYAGLRVESRPLLVSGIVATLVSPYISYIILKHYLSTESEKRQVKKDHTL